jgi:hypothetical protein
MKRRCGQVMGSFKPCILTEKSIGKINCFIQKHCPGKIDWIWYFFFIIWKLRLVKILQIKFVLEFNAQLIK